MREEKPINNGLAKDIEEMIDHIQLLLDVACAKLDDLRKAIQNPRYLKSVVREKEKELSDKITEILRGYSELKRIQRRSD
uniref:Uncharacterized protein n=1 Tax=candidate division WOR-3 bacterium TaxID=2052148 RepID=A0A7C6A7X3_UNCW3